MKIQNKGKIMFLDSDFNIKQEKNHIVKLTQGPQRPQCAGDRGPKDAGAGKSGARKILAMDEDAKPGMRESYFGKRARRRETRRLFKNAHRSEMRKDFRDAANNY